MLRLITAGLAGGIFGAGLLFSGMTDTLRVQGFLDIAGNWDPTLAFVMGGAILPMALAWRIAGRRTASLLGTPIPPRIHGIDPALITGSILFGAGWALAGLCPGPALASLAFGGTGGLVFLLAMAAGMLAAPALKTRLAAPTPRDTMDIRHLTDAYAVSPQITPQDLPALKSAGFSTIINNRPDPEIPGDLHDAQMRAAAEALGLTFITNPVISGAMTMDNVTAQRAAIDAATGPVFAYCASGNRCSVVWALAHAGKMPTDDLISIPAKFGYQLEAMRGRIDDLAANA
jgi:uncharacterized protein (TIGR01244 family)